MTKAPPNVPRGDGQPLTLYSLRQYTSPDRGLQTHSIRPLRSLRYARSLLTLDVDTYRPAAPYPTTADFAVARANHLEGHFAHPRACRARSCKSSDLYASAARALRDALQDTQTA